MANLIVYYSRKGENYWAGSVKNLAKGNTERVAEFVQEAVGGDLFEIETVKVYDADYYKCIDEAKAELQADLAIVLDANGYPPVAIDEAYKEVLEQAENFRKYAG